MSRPRTVALRRSSTGQGQRVGVIGTAAIGGGIIATSTTVTTSNKFFESGRKVVAARIVADATPNIPPSFLPSRAHYYGASNTFLTSKPIFNRKMGVDNTGAAIGTATIGSAMIGEGRSEVLVTFECALSNAETNSNFASNVDIHKITILNEAGFKICETGNPAGGSGTALFTYIPASRAGKNDGSHYITEFTVSFAVDASTPSVITQQGINLIGTRFISPSLSPPLVVSLGDSNIAANVGQSDALGEFSRFRADYATSPTLSAVAKVSGKVSGTAINSSKSNTTVKEVSIHTDLRVEDSKLASYTFYGLDAYQGKSTSISSTNFDDTTKTWTTNAFADHANGNPTHKLLVGESEYGVVSNTPTRLVTASAVTESVGSQYTIAPVIQDHTGRPLQTVVTLNKVQSLGSKYHLPTASVVGSTTRTPESLSTNSITWDELRRSGGDAVDLNVRDLAHHSYMFDSSYRFDEKKPFTARFDGEIRSGGTGPLGAIAWGIGYLANIFTARDHKQLFQSIIFDVPESMTDVTGKIVIESIISKVGQPAQHSPLRGFLWNFNTENWDEVGYFNTTSSPRPRGGTGRDQSFVVQRFEHTTDTLEDYVNDTELVFVLMSSAFMENQVIRTHRADIHLSSDASTAESLLITHVPDVDYDYETGDTHFIWKPSGNPPSLQGASSSTGVFTVATMPTTGNVMVARAVISQPYTVSNKDSTRVIHEFEVR